MTRTTHHRRLAAGALALALLVTAAPAASAATHATDPRSPDAKDAAVAAQLSVVSRSDPRSPDARDAELAAEGRAATRSAVVVSVSDPHGFSWGDAAIGAGAAIGLLLIAAGTVGLMTRRRGGRYPASPRATADIGPG